MSNWAEREEYERFAAWLAETGVDECDDCGALVRDYDGHALWHERMVARSE